MVLSPRIPYSTFIFIALLKRHGNHFIFNIISDLSVQFAISLPEKWWHLTILHHSSPQNMLFPPLMSASKQWTIPIIAWRINTNHRQIIATVDTTGGPTTYVVGEAAWNRGQRWAWAIGIGGVETGALITGSGLLRHLHWRRQLDSAPWNRQEVILPPLDPW